MCQVWYLFGISWSQEMNEKGKKEHEIKGIPIMSCMGMKSVGFQ